MAFQPELLLAEHIEYELRVRGDKADGHVLVLCKRLRGLLDRGVPPNREILLNLDVEEEKARIGAHITTLKQQFEDFKRDPLHGREKQLVARLEHCQRRVNNLRSALEEPEELTPLQCLDDTLAVLLREVKEYAAANMDTILDLSKLISTGPAASIASSSKNVTFADSREERPAVSVSQGGNPPVMSLLDTPILPSHPGSHNPTAVSHSPISTAQMTSSTVLPPFYNHAPMASSTVLPPFFNHAPTTPSSVLPPFYSHAYNPAFQHAFPAHVQQYPFPYVQPFPPSMAQPPLRSNPNPFAGSNQNPQLPTSFSYQSFNPGVANFPSFPSVPDMSLRRRENNSPSLEFQDSDSNLPSYAFFNSRSSQRSSKNFSKLRNPLEKMVRDLPHIDGLDRELLLKFIGRILRMKEQPHLQDEELFDCIFPFTSPPLSDLIRSAMDQPLTFEEFHTELLRQFFPRASFAYSRVDRRQGETESLSSYVQDIIFSARVLKVRMTEKELVDTVLANLNSVSRNHCAFQQRPTTLGELNQLCVISQDYALADQNRPKEAAKNSIYQSILPNKISTNHIDPQPIEVKLDPTVDNNKDPVNSQPAKFGAEKKVFKCFRCDKIGHTARFCRSKLDDVPPKN